MTQDPLPPFAPGSGGGSRPDRSGAAPIRSAPVWPGGGDGALVLAVGVGLVLLVAARLGAGLGPLMALALGLAPLAVVGAVTWPGAVLVGLALFISGDLSQTLGPRLGLPPFGDVVAAGAAGVLALRWLVLGVRPMLAGPAVAGFGLLLVWAGAGMGLADHWQVTRDATAGLARHLVMALLVLAFIDSPRRMRLFLGTLVAAFAVICLLGVYRRVTGSDGDMLGLVGLAFAEGRLTGHYPDANIFASYLVLLIPPCLACLAGPGRGMVALAAGLAAAALGAGLVLTGSRGGVLALASSVPILWAMVRAGGKGRAPRGGWRRGAVPAGMAAVALAAGLLLAVVPLGGTGARFAFLKDPAVAAPSADAAVEGRLASWSVATSLFADHPLTGVGAGNFNTLYQDRALDLGLVFRGEARSAHSLYLETLSEQGLIGLGVLLGVLGLAVAGPLRLARARQAAGDWPGARDLRGLAAGLVAMLAARLFLHDAYPLLMWTVLGLGLSVRAVYADPSGPPLRRTVPPAGRSPGGPAAVAVDPGSLS